LGEVIKNLCHTCLL